MRFILINWSIKTRLSISFFFLEHLFLKSVWIYVYQFIVSKDLNLSPSRSRHVFYKFGEKAKVDLLCSHFSLTLNSYFHCFKLIYPKILYFRFVSSYLSWRKARVGLNFLSAKYSSFLFGFLLMFSSFVFLTNLACSKLLGVKLYKKLHSSVVISDAAFRKLFCFWIFNDLDFSCRPSRFHVFITKIIILIKRCRYYKDSKEISRWEFIFLFPAKYNFKMFF